MGDVELTAQEKAVIVDSLLKERAPSEADLENEAKQGALAAYRAEMEAKDDAALKAEFDKHAETVQAEAEAKAAAIAAEEAEAAKPVEEPVKAGK